MQNKLSVLCIILATVMCVATACGTNNSAETTVATAVETTTTEASTEIEEAVGTVAITGTVIGESVINNNMSDVDTTFVEDASIEFVDYCVLTKESVEAAHPEIEGRTEEEVRDLLSVLTEDELKKLCPTEEDIDIFIQVARGREGNMFRDVTLDSIAKAAEDSSIYYNADCDIVFDYEGNEGVPVAVYYSKPKFLVYDWSLLVADAFRYDAEQIKAFCESEDYETIKTADVATAREILTAHGGEPAEWV